MGFVNETRSLLSQEVVGKNWVAVTHKSSVKTGLLVTQNHQRKLGRW
jgi:hypothetical protein